MNPAPAANVPDIPAPQAADISAAASAVIEQGLKQVVIAPVNGDANRSTAALIRDDELNSVLESVGNEAAAVIIPVPGNDKHRSEVRLNAEQIQLLSQKLNAKSTVVVSFEGSAMAIPVSLMKGAPAGAALRNHHCASRFGQI